MVTLSEIRKHNTEFATQDHRDFVCVFAGATAGIGAATLREIASLVRFSTFYILGRDPHRYQEKLDELKRVGRTNKIVFIEAQISLVSGVAKACAHIRETAEKVDVICVSPSGMPFQSAVYTEEDLESCFTVSYYCRLRLISNLLPLLNKSSKPRVVSILNRTKEKNLIEENIELDKRWTITAVVNHTTVCTSLAFDYLATNDSQKHITFIHGTPGFVSTDTMRTSWPSMKDSVL